MTDFISEEVTLAPDEVFCKEHDLDTHLYRIIEGRLLVCVRKNSQVIPLAYLTNGEFLGELSFFDQSPRSADIISVETTKLEKIPHEQIRQKFPRWVLKLAKQMTVKIRTYDQVIRNNGMKKNKGDLKPLTIDEQRHYWQLIESTK